jgi:hypothetical protein
MSSEISKKYYVCDLYNRRMLSSHYDLTINEEIQLEPRLVEYLKKKKYFKENDIESHSLEREFNISKNDISKIRSYARGDTFKSDSSHDEFIDPTKSVFPSSKLKHDARFDRIANKQKQNKDALIKKNNFGLMSKGYDMYRNDRPFSSSFGDDFRKSEFHPEQWFDEDVNDERHQKVSDDFMKDTQFNQGNSVSQNDSFHENNSYVHPKSLYNGPLRQDSYMKNDPNSVKNIIGKMDSYRERVSGNSMYNERQTDQDRFMVNNKHVDKEQENSYMAVPFMEGKSARDMDIDTYMRFGSTPSRGSKSLGYPNPVDHYFDFVDDDVQNPNNVVMDRGVPSRSYNKTTARPFDRNDFY